MTTDGIYGRDNANAIGEAEKQRVHGELLIPPRGEARIARDNGLRDSQEFGDRRQ